MPVAAPHESSQRPGARDERALMGVVAGWLMIVAAVVTVLGLALPGAEHNHTAIVFAAAAVIGGYGVVCVLELVDWERLSLGGHAVVVAVLVGVVGVIGVWGTGGAASYARPLFVLPVLFVAYFFPPRWAWGLTIEIVLAGALPLAYDGGAVKSGFLSQLLVAGVAYCALNFAVLRLKARMVKAEARQREMAVSDPLTGLGNRRAASKALAAETERLGRPQLGRRTGDEAAGYAVVLFDLDGFKFVNDRHGHPAGDDVLCALASRLRAAVRPEDTVARIGGDEFAVVAPGAGPQGARRLADALEHAAAQVFDPGGEPLRGTAAWALFPDDGHDAEAVVRIADRRLYGSKRDEDQTSLPDEVPPVAGALAEPA